MDKLEEGIGDSLRPKNRFESQWESKQDSCKTSHYIRCRDVGSGESTIEEVEFGGNGDFEMDEQSHQTGQHRCNSAYLIFTRWCPLT